jgi:hypothetical protein
MKLFTVLAATAAAAAVAAAITIPAGADPSAGAKATKRARPQSGTPTELVACLRAHGLNPPDDVALLKPWIARQIGTGAGRAALSACDVAEKAPPNAKDCGGGTSGPAQKPDGG